MEAPLLPGPKARQAAALFENLRWMADSFGADTVGFLTLTFADGVRDRREASRRFNSVMTGKLRARYRCGVVVSERHKSGAIHFHLVVATGRDIRTGIDFAACFPKRGRGDYSTANEALKSEWAWLRANLRAYGFGRHQMQPMRKNSEALARYVGKYISKSWQHRTADDKGARLVRYFGRWSTAARKVGPPWSSRHGGLSPRALAWRDAMKQIALSCQLQGVGLCEANVKAFCGRRWAWTKTRQIRATEFFRRGAKALRDGMEQHHADVAKEFGTTARHVAARPVEWWIGTKEAEDNRDWREAREGNRRASDAEAARLRKVAWLRESIGVRFESSSGLV